MADNSAGAAAACVLANFLYVFSEKGSIVIQKCNIRNSRAPFLVLKIMKSLVPRAHPAFAPINKRCLAIIGGDGVNSIDMFFTMLDEAR